MKKTIISIMLICLMLVIPTYNLIKLSNISEAKEVSAIDTSVFEKFSSLDLREIEKKISQLIEAREAEREEKRLAEERIQNYENLKKLLDDGIITYRQIFSDTLFVGDSLMNGLETYRLLDNGNMITMVSASLYHLEGSYSKIVANNPKNLVLHYGINMMVNTDSQLEFFVTMYSDIVTRLKNDLPDTKIYISGIFNVSENVESRYPCVAKYNDALKTMCENTGAIYIDNSECLPGDGGYYGSDGIHVSKAFYQDVWLPHLFFKIYV